MGYSTVDSINIKTRIAVRFHAPVVLIKTTLFVFNKDLKPIVTANGGIMWVNPPNLRWAYAMIVSLLIGNILVFISQ
jgi:hypothetical protein